MRFFERLKSAWVETGGASEASAGVLPLSGGAAVDDKELVRWASSEPQPLVPILRYAGVMRPLVVLLAVLPALFAFQTRPLTPEGAEWSLRALECLRADGIGEVLDPGRTKPASRWRMQPPAMTWLTAGSMRLFGSQRDGSRAVVAMATTALLLGAVYLFLQSLGNDRLALVGTVLAACQGTLLELSQQPGIEPLALLTMLLTLRQWQFRLKGKTLWNGLSSAVLLGVGWLAGGPIAVWTWLMIAVWTAWFCRQQQSPDDESPLWRSMLDVVLIGTAGLALGGWWSAWMGQRLGPDFWISWLTLGPAYIERNGFVRPGGFPELLGRLIPWTGLAATGVWSIVTSPPGEQSSRKVVLLILAGAAILGWGLSGLIAALLLGPAFDAGDVWYRFVQLSVWLLAAEGIAAILERRLPWVVSAAAVIAAWLELTWEFLADHQAWTWTLAGGAFVLAAVSLILSLLWAGEQDVRRRAVLLGILVVVLPISLRSSLADLRQSDQPDRELQRLRVRLNRLPPVRSCIIVVSKEVHDNPEEIACRKYLLHSLWPHAVLREVDPQTSPMSFVPPDRPPAGTVDLLVSWGVREHFPGPEFTLYSSHDDRGLEVAAYVRTSESPPPDAETLLP